ncbi:hypothetical protein [Desulforamulus ruminis]|uniref:Lipoprotein n=1 Tax=Desulforamulus ruminis (strain ATCC 23193 / DSM 2154 / NCIMB 8452 / DL) TaxID=696281 RepID=F6DN07_DESRL|nr:hypothetical protein [Desulforamulus ruminis]AEG59465.1 hypothetical protein Desru_1190 [Desulforamulus ruminis DSM 2154]
MKTSKGLALIIMVLLLLLSQGCMTKKAVEQKEPVKMDSIIGKIRLESLVCRKETNWVRVTGAVKNNSEYPVTSVESRITLTGEGEIFDSRLITLALGKRLEPGEVITFDSSFDYGEKEIPELLAEGEIIKLRVLEQPQTANAE